MSRMSRNDAPESSATPAIGGPLGYLATRAAEFVDDLTGARDQAPIMARARRQLLIGTASPLGLFIAGAVPALFLLLIWFVVSRVGPPDPTWEIPMLWMMLASMMPATLGYSIARRARFLWLRAGVARAGLFNLAERSGLAAAVVLVLALTIGFLCISLSNRPDRAVVLLLYVAEQWVFAACVFYAGLAATRGWDAGGVLLAAFIGTLLLAHAIVIQPHHGTSAGLVAGALLLLLPVVGLLRWYARRRWLVLDWRIARLLNQPRH
jgi:hypothetical protein